MWNSSSRPSCAGAAPLLACGVAPPGRRPWPRAWVAPPGRRPWPRAGDSFSWPPPLASGVGWLLSAAPALSQPGTLGRCPSPQTWGNSSWPPPLQHGVLPASAPDLGHGIAPLSHALCAVKSKRVPEKHLFLFY